MTRGFHQIMILPINAPEPGKHQSSSPQALVLDQAFEELENSTTEGKVNVDNLEGQLCEISISHDGGFATAVALAPLMSNK